MVAALRFNTLSLRSHQQEIIEELGRLRRAAVQYTDPNKTTTATKFTSQSVLGEVPMLGTMSKAEQTSTSRHQVAFRHPIKGLPTFRERDGDTLVDEDRMPPQPRGEFKVSVTFKPPVQGKPTFRNTDE